MKAIEIECAKFPEAARDLNWYECLGRGMGILACEGPQEDLLTRSVCHTFPRVSQSGNFHPKVLLTTTA